MKRGRKKIIVIGAIALVLIIAATIGGIIFIKKEVGTNKVETEKFTCEVPKKYKHYDEYDGMKDVWVIDIANYFKIYETSSLHMNIEAFVEYEKEYFSEASDVTGVTWLINDSAKHPTAKMIIEQNFQGGDTVIYEYIIHTTEKNFIVLGNFAAGDYEENARIIDDIFETAEFTGTEPQYQPVYEDDKFKIQVPEGYIAFINRNNSLQIQKNEVDKFESYLDCVCIALGEDGETSEEAAGGIARIRDTKPTKVNNFLGKYDAYNVFFARDVDKASFDSSYYYFDVNDKNYVITFTYEHGNKETEKELMDILSTLEIK